MAISKGADVPQFYFQKGQCLSEAKRYQEALVEFDKSLQKLEVIRKTKPDVLMSMQRNVLNGKAHCHEMLGQKAAADNDRRQLDALAQDWEQSLFGNTSHNTSHK